MSSYEDDNGHIQFSKPAKHRRSTLKDLFQNPNMSANDNNKMNERGMTNFNEHESDIENLNYNADSDLETSFENPRSVRQRVRIEDNHGDYTGRRNLSNWNNDRELTSAQHRTTSIHRNIDRRQNPFSRTIPRNLEERRKWVTQAATLNRKPLVEHAQKILEYMQQDSILMTNDPAGEMLRQEALRNMPQSLAVKKIIKRKFMNSVSNDTKTPGCGKMLKYQISIWFSHIKSNIRNISYSYELWYSSLKAIEGNFGSGVSTYFKFLRRLFILNLFMMFFYMCFIVIPQIIFSIEKTGDNVTVIINEANFSVEDLFTGKGYLTDTVMYYGFYTTGRINGIYSMPEAYFYVMICIFISNTVILGISMAKSYRKSFIETMGGLHNVFAHKIFCGWDYGIATNEASNLRSSAIYTELRELLSDYMKSSEKIPSIQKVFIRILQLSAHLFVFGLIGATAFVMWILLDQHRTRIDGDEKDEDANLVAILTAVIVNVIMIVFPMIFRFIGSYEGYKSPKVTVSVTLFRTFLLEIVIVSILIIFWLTHSQDQICWENSLGQEIYRLIIFDFFFSVIFIALFDIARYIIHKKSKIIEAPEFDISGNTFSVIYNQTLYWLGFYFAPLLGVVLILKLFLTWYVRSWVLLSFCVPPKKSWRAAQMETLFLIITFLSSLLLLFVHGYIVLNISTSDECGPFRYIEYMHLIFLNAIVEIDTDNRFLMFLNFIRKPGVIALVLIGMSMAVYYIRAKSIMQRNFVTFLQRRLVLASQDKEFLLKHISEVSSGDWRYQVNLKREGATNPAKLPPNIPRAEYGDMMPGTSSDDLLVTSSTTSFPFSDSSASEYIHSK